MFRNYLRVAFRNILKQKGYNILNTIGLATGMAAGLIIALHIREELSFDRHFDDHENIYRMHFDGWAKSSPPLAIEMENAFPDIEGIARLAFHGTRVVNTDENNPGEVIGYFADSSIFKVFNFKIVEGDAKQAFAVENTAVLTNSIARRYFGSSGAVGKILKLDNGQQLTVTAVIEDLAANSHLHFDYLVSMPTFYENTPKDWAGNRGWMVMYTYVKFKSKGQFESTLAAMPGFIGKFYEGWDDRDELVRKQSLKFMPLADIHLHSNLEQEMRANSNILYVYVFIVVEFLILLIASANFMSLFTTQAIKRMKEVGMRKILGAKRIQLMSQFFGEVILLALISLTLAILIYQLVLPFYNSISGKSLGVWEVFQKENLVTLGLIMIITIVVSGLYPAVFISRFKAGSFIRGNSLPTSMPQLVRSSLIVFQFTVSVTLIAATIFVRQQMNLIQNKELGFDKDQVINIKMYGGLWDRAVNDADVFKTELLKNPNILAVAKSSRLIGDDLSVEGVIPEGKEAQEDSYPSVRVLNADEDYLKVLNVSLVDGRHFSKDFNDSASFIINEEAARVLGLTNPVGKRLTNLTINLTGPVVGVVQDYHFTSLHNKIEPLIIQYKPDWTNHLWVKMRAGKTQETLEYVEKTIKTLAPNSLFAYTFLDNRLDLLYKSEANSTLR